MTRKLTPRQKVEIQRAMERAEGVLSNSDWSDFFPNVSRRTSWGQWWKDAACFGVNWQEVIVECRRDWRQCPGLARQLDSILNGKDVSSTVENRVSSSVAITAAQLTPKQKSEITRVLGSAQGTMEKSDWSDLLPSFRSGTWVDWWDEAKTRETDFRAVCDECYKPWRECLGVARRLESILSGTGLPCTKPTHSIKHDPIARPSPPPPTTRETTEIDIEMEIERRAQRLLEAHLASSRAQKSESGFTVPPIPTEGEEVVADDEPKSSERRCVVCLDRARRAAFMPCRHRVICITCSQIWKRKDPATRNCPVCTKPCTEIIELWG